jgi:uncharacterized membrane protein YbhN (UPF0104 family)
MIGGAGTGQALPAPALDSRRYLLWAVLAFVGGISIAAIAGGGDATVKSLAAVPLAILPVLLALSAANYAMRTLRWLLFSRTLHLGVPPATNALYYVAGFAMTTTPGKVGEALRLWLMRRSHGSRYESTAALLVADRLSDAVAVTAVVAITVGWFAHYAWLASSPGWRCGRCCCWARSICCSAGCVGGRGCSCGRDGP